MQLTSPGRQQVAAPAAPPVLAPPVIAPPRVGLAPHSLGQADRSSDVRPISGVFLLFCALVTAAYLVTGAEQEEPDRRFGLVVSAVLCLAGGLGRLTGNLRPLWLVVGLLVSSFGFLVLEKHTIPAAINAQRALSWPETGCQILSSRVVDRSPEVLYRYTVGGVSYASKTIDFLLVPGSLDGTPSHIVQQYPTNSSLVCYYNPQNPAQATLRRGWRMGSLVEAFPVFIVGLGAVLIFAGLGGRKNTSTPG